MGMSGLALATVLSALIAVALVAPFLFFNEGAYRLVDIRDSLGLVKAILITAVRWRWVTFMQWFVCFS
jgi:hypothetical protein